MSGAEPGRIVTAAARYRAKAEADLAAADPGVNVARTLAVAEAIERLAPALDEVLARGLDPAATGVALAHMAAWAAADEPPHDLEIVAKVLQHDARLCAEAAAVKRCQLEAIIGVPQGTA